MKDLEATEGNLCLGKVGTSEISALEGRNGCIDNRLFGI